MAPVQRLPVTAAAGKDILLQRETPRSGNFVLLESISRYSDVGTVFRLPRQIGPVRRS